MSDSLTEPSANLKLADLERRVEALEGKVEGIPYAGAGPPPVNATQAPSFKDIEVPIPNVQTVVAAAKTTWTIFEMLNELRMLFWTLFDRRYHMAWITRMVTIGLLIAILTSHWWVPFATFDNPVSHLWDKLIDLFLGMILFMVLSFETRRYKEWRGKR